jgi:hypothetical protein
MDLGRYISNVVFNSPLSKRDATVFPCPLKEQEAVAAIKALEGCMAAAIADLQGGQFGQCQLRTVAVDMDRISCFLMSAYITSLDGMTKVDAGVKGKLIG